MHPVGALVTGAVAGTVFVFLFTVTQNRWKIDDVLGVWPLHGVCGAWGGSRAGFFGMKALGGLGGVSFRRAARGNAPLESSSTVVGAAIVYGALKATIGLRPSIPNRSSTAPT
jgi:Amt family ammonium transporter